MYMKLKQEREKQAKTQKQIAFAAGIPLISYQAYEMGTRTPSVEAAKKIAKALNSTVDNLFNNN